MKTRTWYDVCNDCGFWRRQLRDSISDGSCVIPIAKDFDAGRFQPALEELAAEIDRDPNKLHSLDPGRFELLVGSVLRNHLHCEVHHTGRTGDGGVDLIAVQGETPMLIQVKRRVSDKAIEGLETVKLMFASALLEGQSEAMVVTSAQRFTSGARKLADRLPEVSRGFRMSLVAMSDLLDMVGATVAAKGESPYIRDLNRREGWSYLGRGTASCLRDEDGLIVETEVGGRKVYYVILRDNPTYTDEYRPAAAIEFLQMSFAAAQAALKALDAHPRAVSLECGYERDQVPAAAAELLQNYTSEVLGWELQSLNL